MTPAALTPSGAGRLRSDPAMLRADSLLRIHLSGFAQDGPLPSMTQRPRRASTCARAGVCPKPPKWAVTTTVSDTYDVQDVCYLTVWRVA